MSNNGQTYYPFNENEQSDSDIRVKSNAEITRNFTGDVENKQDQYAAIGEIFGLLDSLQMLRESGEMHIIVKNDGSRRLITNFDDDEDNIHASVMGRINQLIEAFARKYPDSQFTIGYEQEVLG